MIVILKDMGKILRDRVPDETERQQREAEEVRRQALIERARQAAPYGGTINVTLAEFIIIVKDAVCATALDDEAQTQPFEGTYHGAKVRLVPRRVLDGHA